MIVDVTLILVIAFFAVVSGRRGAIVTSLSAIGALAGLLASVLAIPWLVDHVLTGIRAGAGRTLIVLLTAIALTLGGSEIGARSGNLIRRGFSDHPLAVIADRAFGAVVGAVMTLLVAWTFVWPFAGSPWPTVSTQVADSRILAATDTALPAGAGAGVEAVGDALGIESFPTVFAHGEDEAVTPVDPADIDVDASPVRAAAASTVKIYGQGADCRSGQTGTGFAVSEHEILTNAHVVAALDVARVQVGGTGQSYRGTIVHFDPETDIAIVRVDDVTLTPLEWADDLETDDQAVALGYPGGGKLSAGAVRVRGVVDATGYDIHGQGEVTREIYSLLGRVLPGDSGGPLVTQDGKVVGVVFARSQTDPDTAFALTGSEVADVRDGVSDSATSVNTGACLDE